MSGHVFISHGSEDSAEANSLAAFIESKGVRAWIAPRDVRPGQDYSEQLQEAIETCVAFVILVTEKANKSPYVRAETEMAFSTAKPIFPVRTTDIKPAAGLAFFLKIRHWTDAFGAGRDASLARLAREIQTAAGVPVDDPPPGTAPPAALVTAPPVTTPPPPVPPPPPRAPAFAAAMPAPMAAPATPATPIDESLLIAAIGPNSDYYIQRWRQMAEKGAAISWNWPACLFSAFWFAYRKMWLPMLAVLIVGGGLAALGAANPALGKVTLLLNIGISFITGSYGNHLYKKQIHKLVGDTAGLAGPQRVDAIAQRGGVSKAATWLLIGLVVLLTLIATAAEIRRQQQNGTLTPLSTPTPAPIQPDPTIQPDPNVENPTGEKPPVTDAEVEQSLQQQGY